MHMLYTFTNTIVVHHMTGFLATHWVTQWVGCNAKTHPIGSSKFLPHPMGYPMGGLESKNPTHGAPLSGMLHAGFNGLFETFL